MAARGMCTRTNPGEPVCLDTFYVDNLKGVGRSGTSRPATWPARTGRPWSWPPTPRPPPASCATPWPLCTAMRAGPCFAYLPTAAPSSRVPSMKTVGTRDSPHPHATPPCLDQRVRGAHAGHYPARALARGVPSALLHPPWQLAALPWPVHALLQPRPAAPGVPAPRPHRVRWPKVLGPLRHRLLRRFASESGRFREGADGHPGGDRCRSMLILPSLSPEDVLDARRASPASRAHAALRVSVGSQRLRRATWSSSWSTAIGSWGFPGAHYRRGGRRRARGRDRPPRVAQARRAVFERAVSDHAAASVHVMTRRLAWFVLVAAFAGCATAKDTPQQEYVWAMGRICDRQSNTWYLDQVKPDGSYTVRGATNSVPGPNIPYFDCM